MHSQALVSQLRLARLIRGKTQFEIARRARISAARLSLIERGHDQATPAERAALAAALGEAEAQLFPAPGNSTSTGSAA